MSPTATWHDEARQMRGEGKQYQQIADHFGKSVTTIWRALNDDADKRRERDRKRKQRARKARGKSLPLKAKKAPKATGKGSIVLGGMNSGQLTPLGQQEGSREAIIKGMAARGYEYDFYVVIPQTQWKPMKVETDIRLVAL